MTNEEKRLRDLLNTAADNYGKQLDRYRELYTTYMRTDYQLQQAKRHPLRFAFNQLYEALHDLLTRNSHE